MTCIIVEVLLLFSNLSLFLATTGCGGGGAAVPFAAGASLASSF